MLYFKVPVFDGITFQHIGVCKMRKHTDKMRKQKMDKQFFFNLKEIFLRKFQKNYFFFQKSFSIIGIYHKSQVFLLVRKHYI